MWTFVFVLPYMNCTIFLRHLSFSFKSEMCKTSLIPEAGIGGEVTPLSLENADAGAGVFIEIVDARFICCICSLCSFAFSFMICFS